MLTPREGAGICGVFDHQLHLHLGILISILAPSWCNLNRMTFINIVLIANAGVFDQYLLPDGGVFD
jgi:hypothetical protein